MPKSTVSIEADSADAIAALRDVMDRAAAASPQAPADPGVQMREVDGGVILIVREDVREALVNFGWMPPVDGDE